ncbi:response regulator [Algihabitans albus]|uniref:response regulator n=1 Tax=Algihabitans albus TaxID=2164067 RepID=UPI000E5CA5A7|nr:response regulator [Algihabitans albus]
MTLSQAVADNLPFLRRFSRALTGSQDRGDRYVAAVLEALVEDPNVLEGMDNRRLALYRLLLTVWGSVNGENEVAGHPKASGDKRLESIAPQSRQVFLLATVERFSMPDIASILNISEADAQDLLEQAGREIAAQVATQVLIIEDEPLIALDLKGLVESLGHTVQGISRTQAEAETAALEQPPGLILADVQLADDSSGVDAVKNILEHFATPVIFITAHPERLLTGEKPEPAFLITKPFDTGAVKAVISQALFFNVKSGASSATEVSSSTQASMV